MGDESKEVKLTNIWNYARLLTKDAYILATAHFYRANYWGIVYLIMGMTSIIFSLFAGTSLLYGSEGLEKIAGILALISSIIIAVSTFIKPHKQEQDHSRAGSSFISLYYNVRVFCEVETIIRKTEDEEQILSKLRELIEERDEIDKISPRIPKKTWRKAGVASKVHFKKDPIN